MDSHEATYSHILAAADYNRMMSTEHLYIAEADNVLRNIIQRYSEGRPRPSEVLEIGSGPARLTPLLAGVPNTHVTALDHDPGWADTAKSILANEEHTAGFICADIETYTHPQPIDIAVSQGTHHHIQKGGATKRYLENIRVQLAPGGIYIVSDEMVPYYANERERYVRLCIWYAHIINNALRHKHKQLATAEMETLLDDIFEGSGTRAIKNVEQMHLVREHVATLSELAEKDELRAAEKVAEKLLQGVWSAQPTNKAEAAPLSRGDYKICFSVFEQGVLDAGYRIRETKTLGPIETIGGFGIYTLESA